MKQISNEQLHWLMFFIFKLECNLQWWVSFNIGPRDKGNDSREKEGRRTEHLSANLFSCLFIFSRPSRGVIYFFSTCMFFLYLNNAAKNTMFIIFLMCFYFSFNIYYWTKITSTRFINSNICLYWLTNINVIVSFTNYKQSTLLIIRIFNNRTRKMDGIILNTHNQLGFIYYITLVYREVEIRYGVLNVKLSTALRKEPLS
jgi:hypothetical protein